MMFMNIKTITSKILHCIQSYNLKIYTNWEDCRNYVEGYNGAKYKSFWTLEDAKNSYKLI